MTKDQALEQIERAKQALRRARSQSQTVAALFRLRAAQQAYKEAV